MNAVNGYWASRPIAHDVMPSALATCRNSRMWATSTGTMSVGPEYPSPSAFGIADDIWNSSVASPARSTDSPVNGVGDRAVDVADRPTRAPA